MLGRLDTIIVEISKVVGTPISPNSPNVTLGHFALLVIILLIIAYALDRK